MLKVFFRGAFNQRIALGLQCGGGKVLQIFRKGKHGIGQAVFFNQPGFGHIHKVFAYAPQTVTARAERRHVFGFHDGVYHFGQAAVVGQRELAAVLLVIRISARIDARRGRNLRYAQLQAGVAHGGGFARA